MKLFSVHKFTLLLNEFVLQLNCHYLFVYNDEKDFYSQ